MEEKLSAALVPERQQKNTAIRWRGDLELEGETSVYGEFALHGMSVPAFEMIVVPRIWDEPRRREREPSAAQHIDGLAKRYGVALDAWTSSVTELATWLRHAPGPQRTPSRSRRVPFPHDDDVGPKTTH